MFLATHNLGTDPSNSVVIAIHANYEFGGCQAGFQGGVLGYFLHTLDDPSEVYENHRFVLYHVGDTISIGYGGSLGWVCYSGYGLPVAWVVDEGVVA